MTAQTTRRLALAAWAGWLVWIVSHYYAVPNPLTTVFDRSIRPLTFWRDALERASVALGGSLLIAAAGLGLGRAILARWQGHWDGELERLLVQLAVGLPTLSYLLLACAGLGLYRPAVIATIPAIAAPVGIIAALAAVRRVWSTFRPSCTLVDGIFFSIAAVAVAFAFVGALAPETEYDALWYHLWLPAKWFASGRSVDVVTEYVSLYPLTWELLYGSAMVIGGPVAAKLLHFMCLPLTGATTYFLARRLFPQSSAALAAAAVVTTPIILWEATTAYVDLALTWYVTLSVYAGLRYRTSGDRRWFVLASTLMGVALAVKHLAVVALVIVAAMAAGRDVIRDPRRAVLRVAAFSAIALLLAAPWYIRAYEASGNPVFPDLYSVFGAGPADRWNDASQRGLDAFKAHFGRERTLAHMATLPWDMTVHAARYGGTLGPLFLWLVPAALIGRGARRGLVVASGCVAFLAVWASPVSSMQMRFVIPLVPWLSVLAATGAAALARQADAVAKGARRAVMVVVWMALLFNLPPTTEWHEPDRRGWTGWMTHIMRAAPAPVVVGAESEADYLARMVPSYQAWQYVDAHLPDTARILTFSGGDQLYSHRDRIWSDATLARPVTWGLRAGGEAEALERASGLGITHVLFDKRQLADGSVSALAIGSDTMRTCCLTRLYEDHRYELDAIQRTRGGVIAARPPDAPGTPIDRRDPRAESARSEACGTAPDPRCWR